MSKGAQAASDKIAFGGSLLEALRSGEMSLSAAAADNSPTPIAWGTEIKRVYAVLSEAPDADAVVQIGGEAGAAIYLTSTILSGTVAGVYDITDDLVLADVPAGEILDFSTDGGATAAGTVGLVAVVGPADPNA